MVMKFEIFWKKHLCALGYIYTDNDEQNNSLRFSRTGDNVVKSEESEAQLNIYIYFMDDLTSRIRESD